MHAHTCTHTLTHTHSHTNSLTHTHTHTHTHWYLCQSQCQPFFMTGVGLGLLWCCRCERDRWLVPLHSLKYAVHAHENSFHGHTSCDYTYSQGDSSLEKTQWLERETHDWTVAGLSPGRSGGRTFFSRVNFLCWLLFRYLFHTRVTMAAWKKICSFWWQHMWQLTAKHACTQCMWLWKKWL